jgi:hypothetical protein
MDTPATTPLPPSAPSPAPAPAAAAPTGQAPPEAAVLEQLLFEEFKAFQFLFEFIFHGSWL